MNTTAVRSAIRDRIDPVLEAMITRELIEQGVTPQAGFAQQQQPGAQIAAIVPALIAAFAAQQQQQQQIPVQQQQSPLATLLPVLLTTLSGQQQQFLRNTSRTSLISFLPYFQFCLLCWEISEASRERNNRQSQPWHLF